MAATKALRDTFGLSQQEIAYFIGASRFQVYSHEKKLDNIAEPQEEVLKRIYLLFQQYKDLPDLPYVPNAAYGVIIRDYLLKRIGDLRHRAEGHSRERARFEANFHLLKIQLEVLKQLMGELPSQDGFFFSQLLKLNSIIKRKMLMYGLEEQLKLTIKIHNFSKQIEGYEEFLNHDLLKDQ